MPKNDENVLVIDFFFNLFVYVCFCWSFYYIFFFYSLVVFASESVLLIELLARFLPVFGHLTFHPVWSIYELDYVFLK